MRVKVRVRVRVRLGTRRRLGWRRSRAREDRHDKSSGAASVRVNDVVDAAACDGEVLRSNAIVDVVSLEGEVARRRAYEREREAADDHVGARHLLLEGGGLIVVYAVRLQHIRVLGEEWVDRSRILRRGNLHARDGGSDFSRHGRRCVQSAPESATCEMLRQAR